MQSKGSFNTCRYQRLWKTTCLLQGVRCDNHHTAARIQARMHSWQLAARCSWREQLVKKPCDSKKSTFRCVASTKVRARYKRLISASNKLTLWNPWYRRPLLSDHPGSKLNTQRHKHSSLTSQVLFDVYWAKLVSGVSLLNKSGLKQIGTRMERAAHHEAWGMSVCGILEALNHRHILFFTRNCREKKTVHKSRRDVIVPVFLEW